MLTRDEEETRAFLHAAQSGYSRTNSSDFEAEFEVHPRAGVRTYDRPTSFIDSLSRFVLHLCFRRIPRAAQGALFTTTKYLTVFLLTFLAAHAIFAPSYTSPPPAYNELRSRCASGRTNRFGCANPHNEKIFISISLFDRTGNLAAGQWGDLVLDLIEIIGPQNVFLSIYENDSGPLGKVALDVLRNKTTCRNSIVYEDHVDPDSFPTIALPDGSKRVKRIIYLAEIRNRALRPLEKLSAEDLGTDAFDKIVFLNDIVFDPTEAANLIFNTNQGQYLTACALDFNYNPVMFYDTFAQRDDEGFRSGEAVFPIFSTAGHGGSRAAVLDQSDAVPVKSCWGGLVSMRAKYVQSGSHVANASSSSQTPAIDIKRHIIDPDHPRNVTSPIRFRGEPDAFYESCECCLFLADVSRVAELDDAAHVGVFVNPYVRTAYSEAVFRLIPWAKRWERLLVVPQWLLTRIKHKPYHNPHRKVIEGQLFTEEVWREPKYAQGQGFWELVERRGRNGMFCGIRDMQVLRPSTEVSDSKNWEAITVPAGQTLDFTIGN